MACDEMRWVRVTFMNRDSAYFVICLGCSCLFDTPQSYLLLEVGHHVSICQ
jgi:hypothetical protein